MFFLPEEQPSSHHVPPRIHHEFTTKTPRKNTRFSRTPYQKTPEKPAKTGSTGASEFFPKTP
jgi:hypothetical protein